MSDTDYNFDRERRDGAVDPDPDLDTRVVTANHLRRTIWWLRDLRCRLGFHQPEPRP